MAVISDQLALPASLEDVKIGGLTSAFYIADFITKEEEQVILNKACLCCLLGLFPTDKPSDCCCPKAALEATHTSTPPYLPFRPYCQRCPP